MNNFANNDWCYVDVTNSIRRMSAIRKLGKGAVIFGEYRLKIIIE